MAPLWSPRGKCRDTTGGPQCWGHGGGGDDTETPPPGDTKGVTPWGHCGGGDKDPLGQRWHREGG